MSPSDGSSSRGANCSGNKPSAVEKFANGSTVVVGNKKVEIVKYLTEGGFAQIYIVKFLENSNEFDSNNSNIPLKIGDLACLKRVLVQDENGLNEMRNEVEVMKLLKGAPNIVQYFDSNASRRKDGTNGFEVLLLMELCPNKSLLDFMNQRLTTKLSEKEILTIMHDVTLAVAQMHTLSPPLIHRDIKIENVLVDSQNGFKLADFGSTSKCFPAVSAHQDIAILSQDIFMHTTPQYRSPEMIDLYKCLPIDEKSDIWALGIFLYKLLFYITPFEMTGQFAILHSKYDFPQTNYSSRLINLIIIMLSENPNLRPNIYQVLHEICSISGTRLEITDKYGQGPYNFDQFRKFQNELQSLQVQMFNLQQRKTENDGKLNQSDEILLNNLYTSTFELSPKIPIDSNSIPNTTISTGSNSNYLSVTQNDQPSIFSKSRNQSEERLENRKSVISEDRLSRHTSSTNDSNKNTQPPLFSESNIQLERAISINVLNDTEQYETAAQMYKTLSGPHPGQSVDIPKSIEQPLAEFNLSAPIYSQRPKSSSSFSSSGAKSSKSTHLIRQELEKEEASSIETTKKQDATGATKQHKSNNPFPKMTEEYKASLPNQQAANTYFMNELQNAAPMTMENSQFPNTDNSATLPSISQNNQQTNIIGQNQTLPQPFQNPLYFDARETYANSQPQLNFQTPQPPNVQQNPVNTIPKANIPNGQVDMRMKFNYGVPNVQYFQVPYSTSPTTANMNKPNLGNINTNSMVSKTPVMNSVTSGKDDAVPPLPPHPRKEKSLSRKKSIHEEIERNEDERAKIISDRILDESNVLIELSPPRLPRKPSNKKSEESTGMKKSRSFEKPRANLDLTYNELDFSQDDSQTTPGSDASPTDELENSMLSSESIDINLDDAKKGKHLGRISNINSIKNDEVKFKSPLLITGDNSHPRSELVSKGHSSRSKDDSFKKTTVDIKNSRRSLDLKYQEVHFTSPDLKAQSRASNPSTNKNSNIQTGHSDSSSSHLHSNSNSHGNVFQYGSTSSHRNNNESTLSRNGNRVNHDLEKYKNSRKGESGSSISLSSEVRNSFSRARQSLDLERLRRDNFKSESSSGKRRSFFSVFKGDKK
ncbi:hypothetical protein Kpol_1052p22 [Vanderwaltozyma polyspora DSM 70294]|uniref:Protein kinase domain-containing protein n=1 Tax=Vanderwaltozyma polyspora (strain ATCC 22028 / DSM 70294 / BCRC 21397 / CBS 2163 / NBRC 10782 / NRRL Y-8283 / UCD 57-17) TaxID=436907 RepID=A7TM33_VANPO|nr:uncharacterized protein Kpol_1052p22 [Vanderwaltozyma polyspora DSM 70294]EDO16675.1 hypothetical protein Kpol_1052p22 [Vanderwaltozyma polyspora DSM 70294]